MDATCRKNLFAGIIPVAVVHKYGSKVQYGYLTENQPGGSTYEVENQKTGQIRQWSKKECLRVDQYISKVEKELDIASKVIAVQKRVIETQRELMESETLGKNLDMTLDEFEEPKPESKKRFEIAA